MMTSNIIFMITDTLNRSRGEIVTEVDVIRYPDMNICEIIAANDWLSKFFTDVKTKKVEGYQIAYFIRKAIEKAGSGIYLAYTPWVKPSSPTVKYFFSLF